MRKLPVNVVSDESARLRARLLERIHRRFETVTVTVSIGSLSFPFTRVADPDRVLDDVAREADLRERLTGHREHDEQLHLPYWAELWDSAVGIGEFLINGGDAETPPATSSVKPRRDEAEKLGTTMPALPANVLDLGCGMGLSGTVAAAMGARVTFADLEPSALLFARLNSIPCRNDVRTRRLNWRTQRLDERFDLILGADILYERSQWESLESFWRGHVSKGGTVLLGEPGRQTGDLFVDWIVAREWILERFEQPVPSRTRPVRIFRLWPRT